MLLESPSRPAVSFSSPSPEALRALTEQHLQRVASTSIGAIEQRLAELEKECPSERRLRHVSAAITAAGLVLALLVSPWLLIVPALSGLLFATLCCGPSCMLSSLLCRRGLRSSAAIERERAALQALRGDFHAIPNYTI